MSKLILAVIVAFSLSSFAQSKDFSLKCVTKLPTTSFLIRTEGTDVIVKMIHHNGVAFMPIHEGIVVPHDLPYLKNVSDLLTKMGEQNEFRFPIKKCNLDGPGQLSCAGGNTQNFNGSDMRAFYFYTSKLTEKSFGQQFERLKLTLSIQVVDFVPVQDMTMNYELDECEMNF